MSSVNAIKHCKGTDADVDTTSQKPQSGVTAHKGSASGMVNLLLEKPF